MPVPTAPPVVLSDVERETLERWARRHNSAQSLALRCRIVLVCAEGGSYTEVAQRDRDLLAGPRSPMASMRR